MDQSNLPSTDKFTVTIDGIEHQFTSVNNRNFQDGLTFNLPGTIRQGQTVTVTYTDPRPLFDGASGVIQDTGGDDADSFGGFAVTNNSTQTSGNLQVREEVDQSTFSAEFVNMPAGHDGTAFTFELRYNESPAALSYTTVRDNALSVTGGEVTKAGRVPDTDDQRWNITVEPDGDDDITIAIVPGAACTESGSICNADGDRLAGLELAFVPGADSTPITASLENVPETHNGTDEIAFNVRFSMEPASGFSYKSMRDHIVQVRQGGSRLTAKANRAPAGQNKHWRIVVTPSTKADMSISIVPTASAAPITRCARPMATGSKSGSRPASKARPRSRSPTRRSRKPTAQPSISWSR